MVGVLLRSGAETERKWPVAAESTIAKDGEGPCGVLTVKLVELLGRSLRESHRRGVPPDQVAAGGVSLVRLRLLRRSIGTQTWRSLGRRRTRLLPPIMLSMVAAAQWPVMGRVHVAPLWALAKLLGDGPWVQQ